MNRIYFATSPIKPVLFLASIFLMLSLIQVIAIQATPETIVKVDPYTSSANIDEIFTVNITVVDVQNLYGIEVTLSWNASILQVVSLDLRLGFESHPDGVLHEPISIVENNVIQEQGKYRLAATSTAPAPSFNGSGNIVRITFNVTNFGGSKLDLETQLWDYPPPEREPRISLPIEHTTIDGFFDIIPEFSNTTILLLFMIILIFVIFSKNILRKT